ncbi:MAG: ribosomal L7Ae/L30e/S12e/Gadd45 family protein [Oscillospiraceae bacterium]|jgi:ribosomal protein L7Ae-like RNA K-turn-binding protein|nr:ribosomal L7Ae/L30e/S12e/Gadd45 family protein [Oscillospiraceae bacterium]
MNDKPLSLIGLARRAGKVALGFDAAVDCAVKKKRRFIFTTNDISPKSLKELRFRLSESDAEILVMPYNREELGAAVGKNVKIVAVDDEGFGNAVKKLITAMDEGEELHNGDKN